MSRAEIRLKNETLAELKPYLITRGVPMPPGAVRKPDDVRVVDADGAVLPSAGKPLQVRPDGSIEWLLMDIAVPLGGQQKKSIYVEHNGADGETPRVENPVAVEDDGTTVRLGNGLSEVAVSREGGSLIQRLVVNGRTIVDGRDTVDLLVADGGGKMHRASLAGPYTVAVLHRNPLRATVVVEGTHQARDGETFLDFTLRLTLTAGLADVKFEHTFHCREDVQGKIPVRSMRLVMPTTMDGGASKILRQLHHGHDWFHRDVEIRENVEVVAANTGDIDNYAATFEGAKAAHAGSGGNVFLRNFDSLKEDFSAMPFHMRPGQSSGFRAFNTVHAARWLAPIVGWKQADCTLVTTFEHFRQLHPKSIEIDESEITYSIWPTWSIPMQIVQGVSKSHIWWITAEPRELTVDDCIDILHRWEYGYVEPVDISFDPAWFRECEVLDAQHMLEYQPDKYPMLENLIEPVPSAGNPSRHTYDRQPAIGMFHFGCDCNADATSCTNNEDDRLVAFPLEHFIRTGHTYAWDYGKEAARHYMEVDYCEWSTDPRQRGGLIPHTGHHFIGNVYPSHQWAEGLLMYYYLSGDERARRAVIGCGDNNVYWAYEKNDAVTCDGREAGMPLVNLAAAYRLTGDQKYIDAARHICETFFVRYIKQFGSFQYPYPQGTADHPHKYITGYGDWSSFAGLYRLWQATGDEYFRDLGVKLLDEAIQPGSFSMNDARGMDFFAAWAFGRMTGDMDDVMARVQRAVPMLLRRGGHPMRRIHFLKELDERGMIDDRFVGTRGGVI